MNNDPETYAIIGAAMEVHRVLGCGFLEAVYQEALEYEFQDRNIPYIREAQLRIKFKKRYLKKKYEADFICYKDIVVETKAAVQIISQDEAQLINYLKSTEMKRGLLINFGALSLEYKRMVF